MYKIHQFIDSSHIYESKLETWLKFLGLAAAWFGGFFWLAPSINITQYSVAFFVYSIALFMEYLEKLLSPTKFAAKLYPLIIILCGSFIFLDSIMQWKNQGMGFLTISMVNYFALVPILILFIDTLSITMIEKSNNNTYIQEHNLFS